MAISTDEGVMRQEQAADRDFSFSRVDRGSCLRA